MAPEDYDLWLQILFMLLSQAPGAPLNLFEDSVKGLLESARVVINIFEYTDINPTHVCVLSDRGFNSYQIPLHSGVDATIIEFNLSSRLFASFGFCDPGAFAEKGRISQAAATLARGQVDVSRHENQLEALIQYNRRSIYQCAEMVLAASTTPLLA